MTFKSEEIDTRAYQANWCEHCRCQVAASMLGDTGNHKRCGKTVEYIPLIVLPVRDFANLNPT